MQGVLIYTSIYIPIFRTGSTRFIAFYGIVNNDALIVGLSFQVRNMFEAALG